MTKYDLHRDFVLSTQRPEFAHPLTPDQIRALSPDDLGRFGLEILFDCMIDTGAALVIEGNRKYISDSTYDEVGGLLDGVTCCHSLAYEGDADDWARFLWDDDWNNAPTNPGFVLDQLCGTYRGEYLNLYGSHPDRRSNR